MFRRGKTALVLVAAHVLGIVSSAMAIYLPEGDGIAVEYPGDIGIAGAPAVVFADGYESVKAGRMTHGFAENRGKKWNNRWDHVWGINRIVTDAENVHGGRQALEVAFDKPNSSGMSKYFDPGLDLVFLRYYIKYDAAFPGAHHVGGSVEARAPGVPHANPGFKATGENKFSVLLDHWSFERETPSPGWLVVYCYHMDQQHKWGEQFFPSGKIQPGTNMHLGLFGKDFSSHGDIIPERDRWYCYELMVQVNTPGMRDGFIAFWVDGKLRGEFPNLRLRSVESLKADRVDIGMYGSRENGLRRVWFDDIVVATEYIGPRIAVRSDSR